MAIKRNTFIRNMARIGLDLGLISVQLTLYACIAALTFVLGGAYLLVRLPNPEALAWYTTIMVLVITLQITQMVRRDRERVLREGFEVDVEHFIQGRTARK